MSALHEEVGARVKKTAELLGQSGRAPVAAALVERHEAPARTRPSLFVAGEDKRGKSCLVNALLSRPDLSPVGVEVVTAAPIVFSYSEQREAKVFKYGEPEPVDADFDQARALATLSGNPRNEHNVRAVQLGVDCPILQRFNLIDTPGVGGLESGHAALTLQSLHSADALIFVTEGAAQFRAEELSFLRRAAARLDTVILVLTKVDLHRGWRQIMADDVAIIRAQAPRFAGCPVVPVSALLALRGLTVPDPEEAAAIREESGLTRLEEAIESQVVARAAVLREVNVLRFAHSALAAAARDIREALASSGPEESRQALLAERTRLQELRQEAAAWPRTLEAEIRKLTLDRVLETSQGMTEIRHRFELRLADVKRSDFDSLPGELIAELTALEGRLNEQAAERLAALVNTTMSDLGTGPELDQAIQEATGDRLAGQLDDATMGSHSLTLNDSLSVVLGFSSGRSIGSLASIAAGSLIAPPVGLAIGLGVGAVFAFETFVTHNQARFRTAFQSWMVAQISQAQLAINNGFQRRILDVQDEIRDAVSEALANREQEITASLQRSQQLLRGQAAQREAERAQLSQRLEALQTERHEVAALLTRVGRPSDVASDPDPLPV